MLEVDLVLEILGSLSDEILCPRKEIRQSGIKGDVPATLTQKLVVQSRQRAGEDVGQEMIQIGNLRREVVAAFPIPLGQRVRLGPKTLSSTP